MPVKSHGPRLLVGYGACGRKELDTTERLHFHFQRLPPLCFLWEKNKHNPKSAPEPCDIRTRESLQRSKFDLLQIDLKQSALYPQHPHPLHTCLPGWYKAIHWCVVLFCASSHSWLSDGLLSKKETTCKRKHTHTIPVGAGGLCVGGEKESVKSKGWLREFDKENDFFHPFNTHINPLGWSNAKDKENYNLFQSKK